MPGACPSSERLAAALREQLSPAANAELAAHLGECSSCQEQLESLAGGSSWLNVDVRDVASPASEPLEKAMRALESQTAPGQTNQEPPSALPLEFLRPSATPGVLGQFAAYEVIEHVASGGMGIVLKARDPGLDRVVALKILPPALAANALARARFVREARAAAAVVHEHVVPIYAVDEWAGLPYLVMQFVQGRPLSDRIRATGPLRLEEVLRIGAQTAAGLAAAHTQGLIHRDVKPGNILLENSVERVKLTDFGLARAVDDAGLTRTGELAGTPEFMAPEQANNEAVDHRADLFSLGSVLYAMCTGCSPFQADSVVAVLRKLCDTEPPRVHEINPVVPRWMSDIVARLMAKRPAERFQSAQETGQLLESYLARVQRGDLSELPEAAAARAKTAVRLWTRRLALGATASAAIALAFFSLTDLPFGTPASEPLPDAVAFVVRDQAGNTIGSYLDADEALLASPPSGVVELSWNGPHEIGPVDLGGKPLTLRAAAGFHPVWQHAGVEEPAIRTEATLQLENIEFEFVGTRGAPPTGDVPGAQPPREGAPSLGQQTARDISDAPAAFISVTDAPLRVFHCFFRCRGLPAPQLSFIALGNAPECVLSDTAIDAIIGRCVTWRQDAEAGNFKSNVTANDGVSLVLSNTALFGRTGVWLDFARTIQPRLEIARCTFRGREAFALVPGFAATTVSVNAAQNVFAMGALIYDGREIHQRLSDWLRWTGGENLFDLDRRFVMTPDRHAYVSNTLAAWNEQWATPTVLRLGTVTFAAEQVRPRTDPTGERPGLRIFQIKDIAVSEGPPLPREQWSFLGADLAGLGPQP